MGYDVLLDRQPTEMDERCQVANEFKDNTNYMMPLAVDTMENHFDESFGAWPVRFFITQNNVLVYKAQPNDAHSYDLVEIKNWLLSH